MTKIGYWAGSLNKAYVTGLLLILVLPKDFVMTSFLKCLSKSSSRLGYVNLIQCDFKDKEQVNIKLK